MNLRQRKKKFINSARTKCVVDVIRSEDKSIMEQLKKLKRVFDKMSRSHYRGIWNEESRKRRKWKAIAFQNDLLQVLETMKNFKNQNGESAFL